MTRRSATGVTGGHRAEPKSRFIAALVLGAAMLGSACAPASPPQGGPRAATPTAPAPMASLTPAIEAASAAVQRRLGAAGYRLEHVVQPFRTGEPLTLQLAPRALFRVMLADPDSGWVVLYDTGSPERAAQAGREFAAYLGSGFGQTNFPLDSQFALSQLDGTLMFSWLSRERSDDPDAAAAAFEELRRVGVPFEVVR